MSKTIHIGWEKAFKAFGIKDDDDDSLLRYADGASSSFCREAGIDGDEDACMRVNDAVWGNVQSAMFEKNLDTIADFIEESLNHVARGAIEDVKVIPKGKRAGISVTLGKPFVGAAAQVFMGTGLAGDWYKGPATANAILNAAQIVPEVYGTRSFSRFRDSAFDRWEPNTGSYYDLKKIAAKRSRKGRY